MIENFGYIPIERKPSDWIVGGQGDFFSPLNNKPLITGNNWERYLPVVEYQNNGGYDRMACVTYSILNCFEILHLHQTNKEANFSDRYIAKRSNTSIYGNNVATVFDTVRTDGLVYEYDWKDVNTDWNDYYKEVPPVVVAKGKEFIKDWDVYREYVATYNKDKIFEALNYAPLQVIVAYAAGDGLLSPTTQYNHAVTCYGAKYGEYWMIYDHYTQTRKKYAWSYEFGTIIKPTFKLKEIPMFKPQNNHLYQLTQGLGGFAMGLDGKLVIDDTDKILASVMMRNQGDTKGKTHPLTLVDWDSVQHINLKGEIVK
jgi:hypothetical protein